MAVGGTNLETFLKIVEEFYANEIDSNEFRFAFVTLLASSLHLILKNTEQFIREI